MRKTKHTTDATAVTLAAACTLLLAPASAVAAVRPQVPRYLSLQPGSATKAEVDLVLGEGRRLGEGAFQYAPPADAEDVAKLVVTFFPDTRAVARIDVWLGRPLPPEPLRARFGTQVIDRPRAGGGREELFFPRLHALVFEDAQPGADASAVGYLSPRLVADAYVERYNALVAEKRLDEARTEADKAVLIDPDYARGYVAQAGYFQQRENWDEAIVRLLAAAAAPYAPSARARAHARLGWLYSAHKGWAEKAEVEFKKGLAVDSGLPEGRWQYASFLQQQNRGDEALAMARKGVELDPADESARTTLGDVLYARRDYAAALPHFEMLSRAAEADARSDEPARRRHFRYAFCLSETKRCEEAIAVFRKSMAGPADAATLTNVGWCQAELGRLTEAIDTYGAAIRADPSRWEPTTNLGNALLKAGRPAEARASYETAARLRPQDPHRAVDLARAWAAQGKKKEALAWLEKAVALGYRDPRRLEGQAEFEKLRKNGDFKKLLARLR